MTDQQRFIIIGGGLAGATAARTLRDEGFAGAVEIISEEPHIPYLRPPLAKEFLKGEDEVEKVFVKPRSWYDENTVTLTLDTQVTGIDVDEKSLTLSDGSTRSWTKILIATGASPIHLNLEHGDANGVHYLRTLDDSESLRDSLKAGDKKVAIIGSGWIGLEVAAAARGYGNEVTVISAADIPLHRALGETLGKLFEKMHEDHGVVFQNSRSVEGFTAENGSVTGVVTDKGTVDADIVVVGVGARPNIALAEAAGIEILNKAIKTDERLQTSVADIYAVGDAVTSYHPFVKDYVHSEHWANALKGGKAAAKSMLGQDSVYEEVPYFYSDQFDINMEYGGFGSLTEGAEVLFRGDVGSYKFIAFWVKDNHVVAGMNSNIWKVNKKIRDLITSEKEVDVQRLQDPEVPIDKL